MLSTCMLLCGHHVLLLQNIKQNSNSIPVRQELLLCSACTKSGTRQRRRVLSPKQGWHENPWNVSYFWKWKGGLYNRYHRNTRGHKKLLWTIIHNELDSLEEMDEVLELGRKVGFPVPSSQNHLTSKMLFFHSECF